MKFNRDLTVYPVTATEAMSALHSTALAIASDPDLAGSVDGLAIMLTKDFLEQPGIKTQLTHYLDRVQPKPKPPILENLTQSELSQLLRTAIWDPNQHRKPNEINLFNTQYKGTSIRGSAVYDANQGYAGEVRLYVRMMPDGLRLELNEDNFELARITQYDLDVRPSSFPSNEPVSATMQWWQGVVERWKNL